MLIIHNYVITRLLIVCHQRYIAWRAQDRKHSIQSLLTSCKVENWWQRLIRSIRREKTEAKSKDDTCMNLFNYLQNRPGPTIPMKPWNQCAKQVWPNLYEWRSDISTQSRPDPTYTNEDLRPVRKADLAQPTRMKLRDKYAKQAWPNLHEWSPKTSTLRSTCECWL